MLLTGYLHVRMCCRLRVCLAGCLSEVQLRPWTVITAVSCCAFSMKGYNHLSYVKQSSHHFLDFQLSPPYFCVAVPLLDLSVHITEINTFAGLFLSHLDPMASCGYPLLPQMSFPCLNCQYCRFPLSVLLPPCFTSSIFSLHCFT